VEVVEESLKEEGLIEFVEKLITRIFAKKYQLTMKNILLVLSFSIVLISCGNKTEKDENTVAAPEVDEVSMLIDSLMYFRKNFTQTDILSRYRKGLSRDDAYGFQKRLLEAELAAGATIAGYKMGGTVTDDPDNFKPMFGFVLNKNMISNDSAVSISNFPGNSTMVEGEVGFILGKDFPEGATDLEALKAGIESVVGGVEFAQPLAVAPEGQEEALAIEYVIATGLGQAGTIRGTTPLPVDGFDFENETVKCYINDSLAAEGHAGKIYRTPLNALLWLSKELPKHGQYLKKGQVVITGGLYTNPVINGPAEVRLEFATLGEIRFAVSSKQ